MAVFRAALPFVVLSAFVLAGCSSPSATGDDASNDGGGGGDLGGGGSGDPPELHVGDHWRHDSSGGGVTVTTTMEVKAIEEHAGVQAYRVEGTIATSFSGASTTAESTTWTRVTDQATIETRATAHLSFGGQQHDSTTTTVYDPPCVMLRWSLSVGQAWTTTCTSTTTSSSGGGSQTQTTVSNFTVQAREEVTVAAGTFDSFRILVESGGQAHTQWISAKACGMVKSEGTAQGQTVTTELTSYDC